MTAVELARKRCTVCRSVLPLASFSKDRSSRDGHYCQCKACVNAAKSEYRAKKRAEMGDDEWRALSREATRRHRASRGTESDLLQNKAYKNAERALREAHRAEFDALYRAARYELGLPIEDAS